MTPRLRSTALVLLGLGLGAGPAPAQEQGGEEPAVPDTLARDTAAPDTLGRDTLTVAGTFLGYDPPRLAITLLVGTTGSGDAQRQTVRAWRTDLDGVVLDSALLSRSLSLRGGGYVGLSGTVGLSRNWALRLGLGYATATLESSFTGDRDIFVASANAVADRSTDLRVVSIESALRYRIPSTQRIHPYLEMGTAASRWTADGTLPEARLLDPGPLRFEVLAGAGGVIPLHPRFSIRLHAATRVFRTPIATVPTGDTLASSSALVLIARPPDGSTFADAAREALSLLQLRAGISWDIGRPVTARPARPAAPDTTSSSRP